MDGALANALCLCWRPWQGRKGHFPEAEKDPVIQIGNVLSVQGMTKPIIQNVFTLKGCLPIVGAQVIINDTEEDMLIKWRAFVQVRRASPQLSQVTRKEPHRQAGNGRIEQPALGLWM